MAEMFTFMGEHPFLAWCLAWAIWPICGMFAVPFRYAFLAYNRRLRASQPAGAELDDEIPF